MRLTIAATAIAISFPAVAADRYSVNVPSGHVGDIFTIVREGKAVGGMSAVSSWQSYCASEPNRFHVYLRGDAPLDRETIAHGGINSRSMYAVTEGDNLLLWDVSTGDSFAYTMEGLSAIEYRHCPGYSEQGYSFSHDESSVKACKADDCTSIEIRPGTWPYIYASANGAVVASTNYGDTLIFRNGTWCRAVKQDEEWSCPEHDVPVVFEPSDQFYSAINYQGKTLLGQYPTGRLYEFDGERVFPSEMSPPGTSSERLGLEAQSVAEYCGDLYVGYWPQGRIMKRDRETGEWSDEMRLFTHPQMETIHTVPYADREPEQNAPPQFIFNSLGQRVTSLVPWQDGLVATTSNKGAWTTDYIPSFMTDDQANEYGAVHFLKKPGCHTFQVKSRNFIITVFDGEMTVAAGGNIIATVKGGTNGDLIAAPGITISQDES